jgi:hypothetical protein
MQSGYDVEPILRSVVADFDLDPNIVLRKSQPAMPAPGMEQAAMPAAGNDPAAAPLQAVQGLNADARNIGDVTL